MHVFNRDSIDSEESRVLHVLHVVNNTSEVLSTSSQIKVKCIV